MIGVFTKKQGTLKAPFDIALGGPITKKKTNLRHGITCHLIKAKAER